MQRFGKQFPHRKLLGQLKNSGLVNIARGVGGAYLAKDEKDITLYDIYYGIEAGGDDLFGYQDNPNCKCPVGRNIHIILDPHLEKIKHAMDEQMKQTTLQQLIKDTNTYL
ncbi:MAG: Rrf2 family transcriptional regulator [Bacillota bacterium]